MKKFIFLYSVVLSLFASARADEFADVESYDAESSLFQKIADLEQEKVLMQLEKDKAQLQLDLDRLAAEQARLVRDNESAEARAAEQAAEIEKQMLAIEQEKKKLDEQKKKLADDAAKKSGEGDAAAPRAPAPSAEPQQAADQKAGGSIFDKYYLREIIGAGSQLVATVEDLQSGKQKKLSVGKTLDGYNVRAISLDDGIEFEKDGEIIDLGIGSFGFAEEER